jgi:hypothetical protein
LLAHGRWFSPGTPASSITKTGRHDITEILLKVALNTINQNQKHYTHMMKMFIYINEYLVKKTINYGRMLKY